MTTNRAYFYAKGKRKTAVATIRLYPQGQGEVKVNGEVIREWSDTESIFKTATRPLELLGVKKEFDLEIIASGGGKSSQADAICLGIARSLVKKDSSLREQLKKEGLLTRDSRKKERKKPGLKRARRAPQFSKR